MIVPDMPDAEYRKAPGYGSTALKWFLSEAPAQARHWTLHPEDAPSFDGAAIGTLTHALVLDQPHGFVTKDWSYSTKDGKRRAADLLEEHGGPADAIALSADDFAAEFAKVGVSLIASAELMLAKGCAEGALRHPTLRAMLEQPGSAECSVFAEVDGVRVKARFDWLPDVSDERLVAVDLKTALSANPQVFANNARKNEYGVQRGAYLDVLEAVLELPQEPELVFAVIDKRPPHLVSFVGLGEPWPQIGRDKAAKARRIIRECETSGEWPDYGTGVHYIAPHVGYVMDSESEEAEIQI